MSLNVDSIVFVHGYSVRTLDNYATLPALLSANDNVKAENIFLSAFVSLDDEVSCSDLAAALDTRIRELESLGLNLRRTAVITHSTGAIITRRWMLDRAKLAPAGNALPSHFISCAGANHGSTLSQLGRSALAYIFRQVTEGTSVGQRVLEDLDYGSRYLRELNREWLVCWNEQTSRLQETFCFSMGGADHSYWKNHLVWQTHETGSDGTVRISGANLNYRLIEIATPRYALSVTTMSQPCAHLIIDGPDFHYSHTTQTEPDSQQMVISAVAGIVNTFENERGQLERISASVRGILDGIRSVNEVPYQALRQAMSVADKASYYALRDQWAQQNDAWTSANQVEANSTIVISTHDQFGNPVPDSLILLRDGNGNVKGATRSLTPHQPIVNEVDSATISLYVNYATFHASHPHSVHVEVHSGTPWVSYDAVGDADLSNDDYHVVNSNEFTYVELIVDRSASGTFAVYLSSDPIVTNPAAPGYIGSESYPPFSGTPAAPPKDN